MLRKAGDYAGDKALHAYFNGVLENIPHQFTLEFDEWREKFYRAEDGGRPRFASLETFLYYEGAALKGFIQYGLTNYTVSDNFDSCDYGSGYAVIQHLHYDADSKNPGEMTDMAMEYFREKNTPVISVFRACFAMDCVLCGEASFYVEDLLAKYGFIIDEDGEGFTLDMSGRDADGGDGDDDGEIVCDVKEGAISFGPFTRGRGLNITFLHGGIEAGVCTVRFLNESVCYLQYLVMGENRRGLGLGSRCMKKVIRILKDRGFCRMNTDTYTAAGFYEKLGFVSTGLGRSYINSKGDWKAARYAKEGGR